MLPMPTNTKTEFYAVKSTSIARLSQNPIKSNITVP